MLGLEENLLLGEGKHKLVYLHPEDIHKCIKIMKNEKDHEILRELGYHEALNRRGKHLSMIVEYYGEVETNLGHGYCFERVLDYDNSPSKTLSSIFDDTAEEEKKLGCSAKEVLLKFKKLLMEEKIVVSNIDTYNFMIQRLSSKEYIIRVIDNIGSPAHIPLAYYFDFLAKRHIRKYWLRFVAKYARLYPRIMTPELVKLLQQ